MVAICFNHIVLRPKKLLCPFDFPAIKSYGDRRNEKKFGKAAFFSVTLVQNPCEPFVRSKLTAAGPREQVQQMSFGSKEFEPGSWTIAVLFYLSQDLD